MSDDESMERSPRDEETEVPALLDRLGPEVEAGDRGLIETLGLLPYALDDPPVRAEVKAGLMAEVERSRAAATGRLATVERRTRWLMPLAAALALALLGLAGLQFSRLEDQQRTIDELSAQLGRVEADGAELAEMRRALARTDARLRMMTRRGTEFCLLKPVGDDPRFARATATMVIAPERDEWFLAVEGLEPCGGEVCYQLWFLTQGGSVAAAAFDAGEGSQRIELGGKGQVPSGVRAISITHERASEPAEAPVTVLFADQAMTLL